MINKALEIAFEAHKGQRDKVGDPYYLHLIRVMQRGRTETEKICGLLHDLIEDTEWTFEKLEDEGFSSEIIEILKCVTKEQGEDYDHFIERVKTNKTAVNVKISDLKDNMDIKRLKTISEEDHRRLDKYLKAYQDLLRIQGNNE